ncbi:MAG: hypothetical protein ACYTFV_03520 [Planctomycetota bacterium]|jgi:hypothetical protein
MATPVAASSNVAEAKPSATEAVATRFDAGNRVRSAACASAEQLKQIAQRQGNRERMAEIDALIARENQRHNDMLAQGKRILGEARFERIKNAVMNQSRGGSGETPPQRGGGDTPPQRGGGETPPQRGGGETPPQRGSGETPPQRGGGETPPQRGGGN